MKRHALFVGVNAYDDKTIRQLRYSIPDASVLEDRFKGFGYSTRLLADPTGAELKAAVMESVEGLGSGDVFLFFFAGHGFTSQDGAHLLFCRDDMQRLLRVNAAGTRVDAIEALTSGGGFHRAFLLDSCRTDCFANVECRGGGTTRDLDFVSVPECTKESGSYYLLRSCDKFRPSLEFDAIGHGLFTQGLLDAMDARDNRLAYCDTSFATAVGGMMDELQRVHHVTDLQRPSIGDVSGPVFSLFDGDFILASNTVFRSGRSIDEQRRIVAIRAKEEHLASEEKRIREERARQEALLVEKQKQIERERKLEEARLAAERERIARERREQATLRTNYTNVGATDTRKDEPAAQGYETRYKKRGIAIDYYRRRKIREWIKTTIASIAVFALVFVVGILIHKLILVLFA